jgi:hypothetical protein
MLSQKPLLCHYPFEGKMERRGGGAEPAERVEGRELRVEQSRAEQSRELESIGTERGGLIMRAETGQYMTHALTRICCASGSAI